MSYRDSAISQMVAPYQTRPVHLGGVLQIMVTRACDKSCFSCTQGSNLAGKPMIMTPDQYAQALESLRGYFGVVGMFGGNPAMHPQFEELCKILRDSWVPWQQRGIWCNHPRGKIATIAETFHPEHSNLNVHMDQQAYDEFATGWPASIPWLKGMDADSLHSSIYVAIKDVIADEDVRWQLIQKCDINRFWSALIGVFRGELRAWFCEIAAAQAMLHDKEPDYPDTGVAVEPDWWRRPIQDYSHQIDRHCHDCGVPLRGRGEMAMTGSKEQVSITHLSIYKPKLKDRTVEIVDQLEQVKPGASQCMTDYIGLGRRG